MNICKQKIPHRTASGFHFVWLPVSAFQCVFNCQKQILRCLLQTYISYTENLDCFFILFTLLYNFVTHILWRQTLVFLQCHILSKNVISEGNLRWWVQHSKLMLAHSIQRNFVGHSIAALTDSDPSPTPSFTQPGHLSPSTSCIPLSNISLIYPH